MIGRRRIRHRNGMAHPNYLTQANRFVNLDASATATVLDSTLTPVTGNNIEVRRWLNAWDTNEYMEQSSATLRPLITTKNAKRKIYGDAFDDYMRYVGTIDLSNATPHSMYIMIESESSDVNILYFGIETTSPTSGQTRQITQISPAQFSFRGNPNRETFNESVGSSPSVLTWIYSGGNTVTNSDGYLDTAAMTVGTPTGAGASNAVTNTSFFGIMTDFATTGGIKSGSGFHQILIYSTTHTARQRVSIQKHLMRKWKR